MTPEARTLRDELAKAFAVAMLSTPDLFAAFVRDFGDGWIQAMADTCYKHADAMIVARDRPTS